MEEAKRKKELSKKTKAKLASAGVPKEDLDCQNKALEKVSKPKLANASKAKDDKV